MHCLASKMPNNIRSKKQTKQDDDADSEGGSVEFLDVVKALQQEMGKIYVELTSFRKDTEKSLNFSGDMMEEMQKTLKTILKENQELKKENELLKKEINLQHRRIVKLEIEEDGRKQKEMELKLEISGLPTQGCEDLGATVNHIFSKVGVVVDEGEVIECHREKQGNVVVALNNYNTKEKILQKAQEMRKTTKIDTKLFNLSGPCRPIFISQKLTQRAKYLLARAKQVLKNESKFKYVWTKYGNVYAREKDGDKVHKILSEDDINKLSK